MANSKVVPLCVTERGITTYYNEDLLVAARWQQCSLIDANFPVRFHCFLDGENI